MFQQNFVEFLFFFFDSPTKGRPYISKLENDFGHLCFGRRIQISGHSDLGIFINDGAHSTASVGSPLITGNLDDVSRNVVAF